MTNRIKLKTPAPKTREEMETLVGDIALLKLRDAELKTAMDRELKQIKDRYIDNLTLINDKLTALMPRALAWAEAHPDDFGKAKSLEMLHGIIGWRTNTPSLKTLSGWTWDRVLEKLKTLPLMLQYIRTKEEVNKQALLGDRDGIGPDGLRNVGLRVVQEDEFFVEPKLTETDKRETVPAAWP